MIGATRTHAIFFLCLCISLFWSPIYAKHWGLIVVGSQGYFNYRHQADACHAYHVLRKHNISADNIIVMMYNDAANHALNPMKGTLYNRPSRNGSEDINVYDGCKIDYEGSEVTPEMFFNVLHGNKTATNGKKVLESTAEDRVFINFIDHGARHFICFPHGKRIYARDLNNALVQMHEEKRYKELVFYVEACESGSMFKGYLPRNLNIFVTTAANTHESSWGTYCPPMSVVNGTRLSTCLGDLYSVNWMQDSDVADLSKESLKEQYEKVKRLTKRSHVLEFGSKLIPVEPVGDFQSTLDANETVKASSNASSEIQDEKEDVSPVDVDARDIPLVSKFYQYLQAPAESREHDASVLIQEIRARERSRVLFESIKSTALRKANAQLERATSSVDMDCYEKAIDSFTKSCGDFSEYELTYASAFADLCASIKDQSIIRSAISEHCYVNAKAVVVDKILVADE